jgi:hypothetical protein
VPSRARPSRAARRAELVDRLDEARALVRATRSRPATRMPVLVPSRLTRKGRYPQSTAESPNPRRYAIEDGTGVRHAAYRLVVEEDATEGQYYGVQGTTWKDPPLLNARHRTVRYDGREYELYADGRRLRLVAWRTPRGTYWVSNTLSLDLTNAEMLGIARSATRAR